MLPPCEKFWFDIHRFSFEARKKASPGAYIESESDVDRKERVNPLSLKEEKLTPIYLSKNVKNPA